MKKTEKRKNMTLDLNLTGNDNYNKAIDDFRAYYESENYKRQCAQELIDRGVVRVDERIVESFKDLIYTAEKLFHMTSPIKPGGGIFVTHPIIEEAKVAISKSNIIKVVDDE